MIPDPSESTSDPSGPSKPLNSLETPSCAFYPTFPWPGKSASLLQMISRLSSGVVGVGSGTSDVVEVGSGVAEEVVEDVVVVGGSEVVDTSCVEVGDSDVLVDEVSALEVNVELDDGGPVVDGGSRVAEDGGSDVVWGA